MGYTIMVQIIIIYVWWYLINEKTTKKLEFNGYITKGFSYGRSKI
jgi:hypothetical protein